MITKYQKELIVSSIVILLPAFVSLWVPELHSLWLPCLSLLAGQWLCFLISAADPGNRGRNEKPLRLVLWIMPILSLLCAGLSYALSAGISLSVGRITTLSLGLMFAAIGNYLPKCRRNYTIGIKVTWALASDENWNATHRFAGRVWVIGGVAVMLAALLPEGWNVFAAVLGAVVISVIPTVYSYRYYKGQLARGEKPDPLPALSSRYWKISAAVTAAILVFVAVMLFSGRVETTFGDDSFTVRGSYYGSQTVSYADIDSLELRQDDVPGSRVFGVGSYRLLLGTFRNEEFGTYTRYTYYKPEACIVVRMGEKVLVLSGKDKAETQEIYGQLLTHTTAQ